MLLARADVQLEFCSGVWNFVVSIWLYFCRPTMLYLHGVHLEAYQTFQYLVPRGGIFLGK
jgi:hypothetical protein